MIIIRESAEEAIVDNDQDNTYTLASQISLNIKGEWDAIEGYNKLMSLDIDDTDRAIIEEIISDEKNHSERLQTMLMKYDGNVPVSED